MDGFYNGTQGSVARPTSRARMTPRLEVVAGVIGANKAKGMTWKELSAATGLHHGQASGALSNLHRMGVLFVRKGWQREKCQVYIHHDHRLNFEDWMCIDEPTTTKAGRDNKALDAVIEAAIQVVKMQGAPLAVAVLDEALNDWSAR